MFTDDFLIHLGPLLVEDHLIFGRFVTECLGPQWAIEVNRLSGLLDFRDYVEDTVTCLKDKFGQNDLLKEPKQEASETAVSELYAQLKVSKDRHLLTLNFLKRVISQFHWTPQFKTEPKYVQFYLDCQLAKFFETSAQIVRYRPLLNCPVEDIELALESLGADLSVKNCVAQAEALKTSLLAVLGLYVSNLNGETEDAFLHVPLPRVFGGPMAIKDSMSEQKCNFKTLVKHNAPLKPNFVLAGSGYLAFRTHDDWILKECKASLVAPLPGLKKHVWALCPETLSAGIYALSSTSEKTPEIQTILDFDLPTRSDVEKPNWIDCQRDSEGSLVLIWGHINPLTGSVTYESMVALEEDFAKSETIEFLDHIAGMPNRRTLGARMDWRDHGNVLSAHHTVQDQVSASRERTWLHKYDICFASTKLMTIETQSRPIQSLFGGPHDFFVLSPLSARHGIQQWHLRDSVYTNTFSCAIPKNPNGFWTSVSVHF